MWSVWRQLVSSEREKTFQSEEWKICVIDQGENGSKRKKKEGRKSENNAKVWNKFGRREKWILSCHVEMSLFCRNKTIIL